MTRAAKRCPYDDRFNKRRGRDLRYQTNGLPICEAMHCWEVATETFLWDNRDASVLCQSHFDTFSANVPQPQPIAGECPFCNESAYHWRARSAEDILDGIRARNASPSFKSPQIRQAVVTVET